MRFIGNHRIISCRILQTHSLIGISTLKWTSQFSRGPFLLLKKRSFPDSNIWRDKKHNRFMAQRSHVPKFGNWEGENVPYTAYFDNARKEKISGTRMNPNDPEENPEAFVFSGLINGGEASEFSPTPLQRNLVRPVSSEKYRQKQRYGHWRNTSDEAKSVGQKSPGSESITDKNNFDNPHQQKRSERKKSMMTENSNSFIPLSPASRARGGSDTSDDLSYNSASVPKFGAWDERDPRSEEGFTVIFNKVKGEKQIAASKFEPAQQPQSSNNAESHKRDTKSKMFCCLF